METTVEKGSLPQKSVKHGVLRNTKTLQRQAILNSLWQDAEWLHAQIHKQRISQSQHRLNMIRVKAYVCQVILAGMRTTKLSELREEIAQIKEVLGMAKK